MNETPENKNVPTETSAEETPAAENPMVKKRWFGRGIYGSKDVPIRVLDACIGIMIVAAVVLTIIGSLGGGFKVNFDTGLSDVTIEQQRVKHGGYITEPEAPLRPGYTLTAWSTTPEPEINAWDFDGRTVETDMTLYAIWEPAQVTVKFDLAGGTGDDTPLTVTYSEPYGTLPTPTREGYTFAGWQYEGQIVTSETTVTATGEHVLTALWQ